VAALVRTCESRRLIRAVFIELLLLTPVALPSREVPVGSGSLQTKVVTNDQASSGTTGSATPIRVALVNHQPLLAGVLRPFLDSLDHIDVVVEAQDAHVEMETLVQSQPDVVLVQVHGGPDGVIVRTLADRLLDARLIVLSGADSNEAITTAFDAGAHGYLSLALPLSTVIDAIVRSGREQRGQDVGTQLGHLDERD
jgi:ActR/RegA family two-component response regulator